jgi:TatD DNase family protein
VKGSPSCRSSFPCASLRRGELPLFDELLLQGRYIGEIGLDGAPEFRSTWKDQMTVFEHILTQSQFAGGRIMSIHGRRATRAVLDCLEKFPQAGSPILYRFSGSLGDLDRAIELRCWFSVGPAMLASVEGASSRRSHAPGPSCYGDGRTVRAIQRTSDYAMGC